MRRVLSVVALLATIWPATAQTSNPPAQILYNRVTSVPTARLLGRTTAGAGAAEALAASAVRTLLSLVIGTNVEAWDADLDSYATVTPSANALTILAHTFAQIRTDLSLGTSALVDTGTSGTKVPLLDGANTWSGAQTQSANPSFFVTNSSDQTGIASATITTLTWAVENSDVGSKFASNEWCPGWTGSVQLNVLIYEVSGTISTGTQALVELQKGTTGAETIYQYGPLVRSTSTTSFGGMAFSVTDAATSTTCYRLRLTASTTSGTLTVSHFSSFSGRAF